MKKEPTKPKKTVNKPKKYLVPEPVKKSSNKALHECSLCGDFVASIVGLKIPDPEKFDEYPTSFSYVCPVCYEKFANLKKEIIREAEERKKELESRMDPEDERYQKMKNVIASGRITPKRRQEIMEYLKELANLE